MIVRVLKTDFLKYPADLLAVGVFEGEKQLKGFVAELDKALGGIVSSLIKDEGFKGKEREILFVQTHGRIAPKRVVIIGLGKQKNSLCPREMAAVVVKYAKNYDAKTVAVKIGKASAAKLKKSVVDLTEGALLGSYKYITYHGQEAQAEHERKKIEEFIIIVDGVEPRRLVPSISDGKRNAEAVMFVRNLVNTPASDMTPRHMVDVAKELTKKSKRITLEVFDEKEMHRRNMGALLAVAKGSDEPPYFIHLKYHPSHKASNGKYAQNSKLKKVFLVGKGITFDSGGLSLKPSKHMESMKTDMAGGAVVLGIFSIIEALNPSLEVHGLIPCTENMPSGKAAKPGDIARAMNSKTIEILNTDAEGRVVLADALSFAVAEKADTIIDLATLTGSCIEALGEEVAGLFSNNAKLGRELNKAAEASGEYVWEMPLVKEYQSLIKSKVADIKNIGGGHGAGSITAALFLKEFVGETPWVHLDIAGPAWAEKETFASVPLGATGFGVRILIEFLHPSRP